MYDYNETDESTCFPIARESFTAIAMRGNDIGSRKSYAFFIREGAKAAELLQDAEEDGFIDHIDDSHHSTIDNAECVCGQVKTVSGDIVFSECGEVIRIENVIWSEL